ncbi:MAG: alpha/beta fold hydrolase [Blastocatellia bacterium]|nr:alpha/beta fold hydrolase [Blastocatellia bacterium]
MKRKLFAIIFAALLSSAYLINGLSPVQGQQPSGGGLPDTVATRAVNIWSDGTRLSGDLFYPKAMKPDDKLPAIVLCHGWGGVKSHLNRAYAPQFAAAGYVVLTFDYRGWGESDSRLVIEGQMPKPDEKGEITVRAQAIRELVDPFDQTEDIRNAINFVEGEPGVDPDRIGLWGTSYGGGHVVYVGAHDPRVKCIVSQVASMDSRLIADSPLYQGGLARAHKEELQRARGEGGLDPVPQGVDKVPNLRGTPYVSRMVNYRPVEFADRLKAPILILDAEKEELLDIKLNGGKVYERVKGKIPARYHIFPGIKHYDIYTSKREEGIRMALEWYDKYLKGDTR